MGRKRKSKGGYYFSSFHDKKSGADRKAKKIRSTGRKALTKKVAGGYMVVASKK